MTAITWPFFMFSNSIHEVFVLAPYLEKRDLMHQARAHLSTLCIFLAVERIGSTAFACRPADGW